MYKQLLFIALVSFAGYFSAKGQNPAVQSATDSAMFTLNCASMSIVIDVGTGARIVSFKLDGNELLASKKVNQRMYGSTLWPSPEGKWKGQGILDDGAYSKEIFSATDLSLKSLDDTLRGFEYTKQFHANKADTSIEIRYVMTNISKEMQEVAPWEVTRVLLGGLVISPKSYSTDFPTANKMYPLPAFKDSLDIIWYPYDSTLSRPQKLFMDGSEGWIAYIRNNIIFIKKFPDITADQAAPGEKNVEFYVSRAYMELENQGAYQKLNTGGTLTYEVKWYARRLPAGLKVETGNLALVNYIRSVVNKK